MVVGVWTAEAVNRVGPLGSCGAEAVALPRLPHCWFGGARRAIFAVAVGAPRGDPARRKRTRPIAVELRVGRYDVSGNIHVVPGTDPVMGFRRRRMMVPLTEATIELDSPDGRQHSRSGTILVNRDLTDWIGPATRSDVRPPELVPELRGRGLAKDFTPLMQGHEA